VGDLVGVTNSEGSTIAYFTDRYEFEDVAIRRTVCINSGSEYEGGTLMGTIIDLEDGELRRHSVAAG